MHWKKLLDDQKYIGAYELKPGEERVVTIKSVAAEEIIQAGGKKDTCRVATLAGKEKPFILNATNSKTIAKLYGNDIEGWVGKTITIYASTTSVAGEQVECLRIRPVAPGPRKKTAINEERFAVALTNITDGKFTVEKLLAAYDLTEEQLSKLPRQIEGSC